MLRGRLAFLAARVGVWRRERATVGEARSFRSEEGGKMLQADTLVQLPPLLTEPLHVPLPPSSHPSQPPLVPLWYIREKTIVWSTCEKV
jgi:hypothetical protein